MGETGANAEAMNIRLWLISETDKARLYSKLPPERMPDPKTDYVWIPRSVVNHTLKLANGEHHLKIEDWFAEKEGL